MIGISDELSSRSVSRQVFSPQQSLTSVFGMGTGGPSAVKAPTNYPLFTDLDPIFINFVRQGARSQGYGIYVIGVSNELSSRSVSRRVFSPQQSLTSVFGMGTGGPSAIISLTIRFRVPFQSKKVNS